jgi:ABC-type Co2+ transport system permease subunit
MTLLPSLSGGDAAKIVLALSVATLYGVGAWRGDVARDYVLQNMFLAHTAATTVLAIWFVLAFDVALGGAALLRLLNVGPAVERTVAPYLDAFAAVFLGIAFATLLFSRPRWAVPAWFRAARDEQRAQRRQ